MQTSKTKNFRFYLKWALWVVVAQFVLANVSASIYAYKFTHFYDSPAPRLSSQNVFNKTWKLFVGPSFYRNTNEPEPSFAYENISLKTPGGIPIDGWYSSNDSSRSCVILVHGYSTNKSFLENEAAIFRQWGYSVLLIDLRGHGRSGGDGTSFGMKETGELQAACRFARERGKEKIILYGVSMGAAICIKAVAEGKVKPQALIADMPFASLHDHFRARARVLGFPAEPFASLVTFWIGMENGYNGFEHNVCSYASGVNCPVLMEWGDQDQYVMKQETENIFTHLAAKHKKLVVFPGARHSSFLQVDPLTWEKEVQSFLNSVK